MTKRVSILIDADTVMIDKAIQRADKDFPTTIPLSAITRMLLGLYGDGELVVKSGDPMKYSPESFKRRKTRKPEP